MAAKRPAEERVDPPSTKRTKNGGHINLPEGRYKRKVEQTRWQSIKDEKIKKSYEKLKAREQATSTTEHSSEDVTQQAGSNTRHPDRQALIDGQDEEGLHGKDDVPAQDRPIHRHQAKPKPNFFQRDQRIGQARQAERNRKQEERIAAAKERDKRLAQRERWRRTMANVRGDGRRRKVGKESTVLLEKVKRMLGNKMSAA